MRLGTEMSRVDPAERRPGQHEEEALDTVTGPAVTPRGHSDPTISPAGNLAMACGAELIGTFMLVLVGTAVASAAALGKNTAGPAYDSLAVALSFGLILIPIVASLGPVSGAHVNPAVTFGLAVAGKFPWRCVLPYWVAQLLGARCCASLVLWAAYAHGIYDLTHLGAPSPAHGATHLQVLLVEALIAFLLVFTVYGDGDGSARAGRVGRGRHRVRAGGGRAAGRSGERRGGQPGQGAGAR